MKKIYAGAITAWHGTEYRVVAAFAVAKSEAEALGTVLQLGRQTYPPGEGWTGHQVSVHIVDDKFVEQAAAELK